MALLLVSGAANVLAEEGYQENGKLVRGQLTQLGTDLFGERVSAYTGALSFSQTDVSLPGNFALPVAIGRRLTTGSAGSYQHHFGEWELEIPHLKGVFDERSGWQTSGVEPLKRCSIFLDAATGWNQTHTMTIPSREFWHGYQIYVPGIGEQDMLSRAPENKSAPTDGNVYGVVTKQGWQFRCTNSLHADSAFDGEGFIALSPDGVEYTFNWMVARSYPAYLGSKKTGAIQSLRQGMDPAANVNVLFMPRSEVLILPTKIKDRHGNTVTYSYDKNAPWRLLSIDASDQRSLRISYHPNTNLISTVSDGMRTWSYEYSGISGAAPLLSRVVLPDATAWTFGGDNLQVGVVSLSAPSDCSSHFYGIGGAYKKTMTHPSGAVAEFTLTDTEHARTDVTQCKPFLNTSMFTSIYPSVYIGVKSLTQKKITAAGLLKPLIWQYEYPAAVGSNELCPACAGSKTVIQTFPSGAKTRLTFGTRWSVNEGLLLKSEEGWDGSAALRVTDYRYRSPDAGPYPSKVANGPYNIRGDGAMSLRHFPLDKKVVTQQGRTFTWEATAFDEWARPTTVVKTGPAGSQTETISYEDKRSLWVLGQLSKLQIGSWLAVGNEFNEFGQLKTVSRYGVLQRQQGYNADGTLAWHEDGAGHRTSYDSYKRGVPRTVRYADGSSESASVNDLGLITRHTDPTGASTDYGYDAAGRLSSITPPSGWTATSLVFEPVGSPEYGLAAGHWRQTISQGDARTVTYYDGFWRPVMVRTFDASQEASTRKVLVKSYDAAGQLAFESYAQRDATSVSITSPGKRMSYDALGRLKRTEADSELGVLVSSWDYQDGFKTVLSNPRGKSTTQTFWALDKPEEAQLAGLDAPEGVSVRIERDALGKPTAISRGGVTRRYVYDAGQRLCKTVEPEINATVQDYDAAGNVLWRAPGQPLTGTGSCDTAAVASTAKISYGYDPMNRLKSTSYGDTSPGITREYWPDGKLKTVSSNGSTWSYVYNSLRLISTETLSYGGQSWIFSWGYSPNGHLASLSYPTGGPGVSYVPNALGEPSQVGSFATGLSFHPNGAVNSFRFGNGIQHTQGLNLRGLPESKQDAGVLNDVYVYDANGNVNSISDRQENVFSRSMVYDDLDRLKTVSAPGVWGTAAYTYDAADNLKTANVGSRNVTLNYLDGTNRLNRVDVNGTQQLYDYDPYGNIKRKGAQQYFFDQGNRLQSAVPGGSYVYDGLGRRIQVSGGGDGSTRLSLYSQAGQLLWSTSSGGSRPASTTAYIYLAGKAIAEVNSASGTQYVHTDVLGSPVAHTGPTGTLLNRTRYEPYGYVAAGTKPGPATSLMGYTGHVQDAETELVYMQQRYYDPIVGRFLSVDPIVTDANTGKGFGLYTYVDNNPYAKIDPDGREPAECSEACVRMRGTSDARALGTSTTGASRSVFRAAASEGRALAADFPSFPDTAKLFLPALMLPSMAWEGTMGTFDSLANVLEGHASKGDGFVLAMAFLPAAKGAAETVRVGELIATHGKTMSNKQLDRLVKNIRAEGIKEPLTVTEHQGKLYILDGHHRALAAPRAGVAEVPIKRVELPFGAYKTPDDLTFTPGGY